MIKTKKVLLGSLATVAMVATPIAAVVSCGPKKATEAKMDPFYAKLEAMPQKGQSVSEYKASVIEFIKSHYAKSKDAEFTATDLKTVTDAKTGADILTAAEAISGIKKEIKEVNTVLTIKGKDYDFGKFLSDQELRTAVTSTIQGNAAVKAKPEVVAKDATEADKTAIDAAIDAAQTKEAIVKILEKYTTDNKNAQIANTSTISSAQDVNAAKAAAKTYTTNNKLFNKDVKKAKPAVVAKAEVATVLKLTITKADGTTEFKNVDLGKFVDMTNGPGALSEFVKQKTRGQAKQAATTNAAAIGQQVIAPIFSLDDYASSLIALFTSDKTIFTNKEKKTPFKADDEFMKTITDAAKKDKATGATVLAAAKAVKFFR